MKETYERTRLTLTAFEQGDVITTSGEPMRVFKRDEYEGFVLTDKR